MRLCKVLLTVLLLHISATSSYEFKMKEQPERTADFRVMLKHLLKYEGFYAFEPNDRGLETYAGISRRFNPDWYGWRYVDKEKKTRKVRRLRNNYRIEQLDLWVLDYYLTIWVREGFYRLKDQQVANYLFEFRINGTYGVVVTKKVLKSMGYNVELNNTFSEEDMLLINKLPKRKFLHNLKDARVAYYKNIVYADATQAGFLGHWLKRANNI